MTSKKRFLSAALVFLLASCNQANISETPSSDNVSLTQPSLDEVEPIYKEIVKANIEYNKNGQFTSIDEHNDYKDFISKLSSFSAGFTEKALKDNNENSVCSPLSIYMSLAMLEHLATGSAKQELINTLNIDSETISKYSKVLFEKSLKENIEGDVVLGRQLLSNSIWLRDDLTYYEEGLTSLANEFYCDSFSTNFGDSSVISKYIKEKTFGLLSPTIDIPYDALAVLVNTVYLQETWDQDMFDGFNYTDNLIDFKNADNSVTSKKMLSSHFMEGRVVETESYKTFYVDTTNNYKFHFIVPNDGYSLSKVFTQENIDFVNKLSDYGAVDVKNKIKYSTKVYFPEFNIKSEFDVKNILSSSYNVSSLFTFTSFPSITDKSIAIHSIIQECLIDVNKKGVVGGAYTASFPTPTQPQQEAYTYVDETFIVDKNFGFIVSDSSDVIIFSGIVNNIQ